MNRLLTIRLRGRPYIRTIAAGDAARPVGPSARGMRAGANPRQSHAQRGYEATGPAGNASPRRPSSAARAAILRVGYHPSQHLKSMYTPALCV